MAMKGYSAFPKAPALLEPHHQIVYCHIQDTRWGGGLPLCREAVSVFYSPSRLGKYEVELSGSFDDATSVVEDFLFTNRIQAQQYSRIRFEDWEDNKRNIVQLYTISSVLEVFWPVENSMEYVCWMPRKLLSFIYSSFLLWKYSFSFNTFWKKNFVKCKFLYKSQQKST